MAEILGATILGVIFQGVLYKFLTKRSVSKVIAVAGTGILYAILFIGAAAAGLSGDAPFDLQKSAAIAVPGTLIASAIIFLVSWSQTAEQP